MIILGINAASHNTSAAIVRDGKLLAFAEEERFNRERYTMAFPEGTIRFCLEQAGVEGKDVDMVVFAGRPRDEILHSLWGALRLSGRPWYRSWLMDQVLVTGFWKGFTQGRKVRGRTGYLGQFGYFNHHDCHAASAFYCAPFEECAVLTIDAQGDGIATALYQGRGNRLERLRTWGFPEHSIGHFYDCVGEWVGFKPVKDAGKTMGLAPYGDPHGRRKDFDQLVRIGRDGDVSFDLEHLKFEVGRRCSTRFEALFGPPRDLKKDPDPTASRWADVAAGAQRVVEESMIALARYAKERTGMRNLCIAGGVGLNSVGNGKLDLAGIFDEVWIQPAAYDAGLSVGAAFLAWHELGRDRNFVMEHAYWGPDTKTDEVRKALDIAKAEYRETDDPSAAAASLMAQRKIVGWYQGRAEVGPRALGNRSILANPQGDDVRDVVNREVKHREPFRPFAPSCTLEEAYRFFESGRPTPFMLKVWQVQAPYRAKLPAVTHVDGSARLQTVTAAENPRYHRLLEEMGRLTGIPCALNTSFNIRGEPIVNSPMDALKCFFTTGLDALVIDRFVLEKRRAPRG
jgi:carbamoyltransferase